MTTGFGVVENNAKLKMGESVVVFGAGGIGLNIVQAAALVSAGPIIAVDRFESRLELAQQMGATHCINSSSSDPKQAIGQALNGQVLDVFIDNTGVPTIIELGYALTHRQGRVVLVGVPRLGNTMNLYSLPLHFGKQLIGSQGGETLPQQDIPRYLRLQQRGKIQLEQLVSAHYSLEKVNSAISAMRDGATAWPRNDPLLNMPTQSLRLEDAATWRGCVLAYGHFNTIHPGHIRYLRHARGLGEQLVVALIGDTPTKFTFQQQERAEALSLLGIADACAVT